MQTPHVVIFYVNMYLYINLSSHVSKNYEYVLHMIIKEICMYVYICYIHINI